MNKAFIAILFCAIFHNSPLDDDTDLLTQRIRILNFLPPPKMGQQDEDYKTHVARSKNTLWSGKWREKMKRKVLSMKIVFVWLQETVSDAIVALANITTLLEFIVNDSNQCKLPLIIKNLRKLGKILSSARFTRFSAKIKPTYPWFTYVIICHIQSILNNHISVTQNYGYHEHVEGGLPLPSTILDKPIIEFEKLFANIKGATNNSTALAIFSTPHISFRSKTRPREEPRAPPGPQREASLRGWLVFTNSSVEFSREICPPLCKHFAEEGKSCRYSRTCHFKHRIYPQA